MKSIPKSLVLLALALLVPSLCRAVEGRRLVQGRVQEVDLGATPDDEEYNELRQSVALLADGSYASVWITNGPHGGRLQIVRPDGSELFAGGRSITNSITAERDIVVAANPSGGAFVAVSVGTADGMQLFVQSFDAAGNPRWRTEGVFAASTVYGDDQLQPQLVAAPQGGVYLCFQDFHSVGGGGRDIVCQRLSADGRRLWTDQGLKSR
jgi:hypothetical protein